MSSIGEIRIDDQALAGSGWVLREATGPARSQIDERRVLTPPRRMVCGTPISDPSRPPITDPTGIAIHLTVRTVALMRPCTWSAVMACRRLTWLISNSGDGE